jgi:hypothetical protein
MFRLTEIYIFFTHFVKLAARMYQIYCLKTTLYGLKHVGVTYSVNKVVT